MIRVPPGKKKKCAINFNQRDKKKCKDYHNFYQCSMDFFLNKTEGELFINKWCYL